MSFDPEAFRAESRDRWERSAPGWGNQQQQMSRQTEPVTRWLLDALELEPGQTVLELACGPGDAGIAAAERLRPGGRLIATDATQAMVDLVTERAKAAGLDDVVEAKAMDAEWTFDFDAASVDAVLCRWGYMLMADPGTALRETRRVLRSGGRVALSAWAETERNPWMGVPYAEIGERGLVERPPPGTPGPMAWAHPGRIAQELEDAGFVEPRVEVVEFTFSYPSLDDWWDAQLDLSTGLRDTVAKLDPAARDDLRDAIDARLQEHVREDGGVDLPAATQVAVAEA
jgi:SAM-dependent methyltransferase